MQAPKGLGKGNVTPRKVGYLLGYGDTLARSGTAFAVEFAHTDQQTYTKLPPLPTSLAWYNGDLPIGYPSGTNGNQVYARVNQRVTPRVELSLDGYNRQRSSADFPAVTSSAVDLAVAYRLGASQSVGLRYSNYRQNPYPDGVTLPPGYGAGGADYGQTVRRHLFGISFLQGF